MLCLSLVLPFGACNDADNDVPTKDEVRSGSDTKADHDIDWCEELNWYGDGICDDFCISPDPDCVPVCGPSDCGPQPNFQPRLCDDGTSIFPDLTCEASDDGNCGWQLDSEDCPEDE